MADSEAPDAERIFNFIAGARYRRSTRGDWPVFSWITTGSDWLAERPKAWLSLIHPDDRDRVAESLRCEFDERGAYRLEYRAQTPAGDYRWVEDVGGAESRGRSADLPPEVIGFIRDIERDRVSGLSFSDLEETLAQAKLTLWAMDRRGTFTTLLGVPNENKQKYLGLPLQVALGHSPPAVASVEQVLRGESSCSTLRYGAADRYYSSWQNPIRRAGVIDGALGMVMDVSEWVRLEEGLKQSEELKRLILETVPSGIVVVGLDGTIREANRVAQKFLQLRFEPESQFLVTDYRGRTIHEDGTPISVEEYPVSKCLTERTYQPPTVIGVEVAGQVSWGLFSASPMLDPVTKDFLGVIVTFVDITERKRFEEERERLKRQLYQSHKLEAIGRLAGGVAHDFNNLLTGILGHAELLKMSTAPNTAEFDSCETIELAAERGASLTRQLLGFARKGKYQNVAMEMSDIVAETVRLLARTIGKSVRVTHRPAAGNTTIFGDPAQIQQVVLNLALNARDAMPRGGELSFSLETVELDAAAAAGVHGDAYSGVFRRLDVGDTGVGITSDVRERMFEPFFTTKTAHQGSGMGLAMVYGIVKNHEGWITVRSAPGEGATFSVYLPAAGRADTSPQKRPGSPLATFSAQRRVLVVDDEELVRRTTAGLLTALGLEVVAAASAREAISLFSTCPQDYDLVLLDLTMPGLDGRACFGELKRIDASVRVVLCTGYGENEAVQSMLREGLRGFLHKPYRQDELIRAITDVLT